jgi:DnaJ-class molecular chaperone
MEDLITSFENFLKENHPDICISCWGEGRLIFQGHFVTGDIECPICQGTGKREEK